jgi:histone deacetylase 1/2
LKLENQFQITKTTNPKAYLGIEIERQPDGIHISQTKYAKQMLDKYKMQESREMKTPMATTPPTNGKGEKDIKFPYREAVGSLLYMTSKTRPKMAFAINVESRTFENPDKINVQNVKRTLRYVKGTQDIGIKYTSSDSETENSKHLVMLIMQAM